MTLIRTNARVASRPAFNENVVVIPPAGQLSLTTTPPRVHVSDWQAAQRGRRSRRGLKMGVRVLPVPVFCERFTKALIDAGELTEAEALIPANIVAAAAEIVGDWLHLCERDQAIVRECASRVTRGGKKRA